MPILTLANAQLAHGDLPLLDRSSFAMDANERIGLIGRNGTGKSSLLAVIAGTVTLDGGDVRLGAMPVTLHETSCDAGDSADSCSS